MVSVSIRVQQRPWKRWIPVICWRRSLPLPDQQSNQHPQWLSNNQTNRSVQVTFQTSRQTDVSRLMVIVAFSKCWSSSMIAFGKIKWRWKSNESFDQFLVRIDPNRVLVFFTSFCYPPSKRQCIEGRRENLLSLSLICFVTCSLSRSSVVTQLACFSRSLFLFTHPLTGPPRCSNATALLSSLWRGRDWSKQKHIYFSTIHKDIFIHSQSHLYACSFIFFLALLSSFLVGDKQENEMMMITRCCTSPQNRVQTQNQTATLFTRSSLIDLYNNVHTGILHWLQSLNHQCLLPEKPFESYSSVLPSTNR